MQSQRSQRVRPAPDQPSSSQNFPQRATSPSATTPYLQPRPRRRPPPAAPISEPSPTSTPYNYQVFPLPSDPNSVQNSQPFIVRRPKRPPPGAPRQPVDVTTAILNGSGPNDNSAPLSKNSSQLPFPPPRSQSSDRSGLRSSPNTSLRNPLPLPPSSTGFSKTSSEPAPFTYLSSPSTKNSIIKSINTEQEENPPFMLLNDLKSSPISKSPKKTSINGNILTPPSSTNAELILNQPITKPSSPFSTSSTISLSNKFLEAISPKSTPTSSPSSYINLSPPNSASPQPLDFVFSNPNLRTFWLRMTERMHLEQKLKQTALDTLYLHAKLPDLVAVTHTQLGKIYERIEMIYQGMILFLLNNGPESHPIESEPHLIDSSSFFTKPSTETKEKGVHVQFINDDLSIAYEELQTKYNEQSVQFAELLAKSISQPDSIMPLDESRQQGIQYDPFQNSSMASPSGKSDITNVSTDTEGEEDKYSDQRSGKNFTSSRARLSQILTEKEQKLEESEQKCEELESELATLRVQVNAHQDVLDLAYSREAQLLERLMQYENQTNQMRMVDERISSENEVTAFESSNISSTGVPESTEKLEKIAQLQAEIESSMHREMELKMKILEAQEKVEDCDKLEKKYLSHIEDLTKELDFLRSLNKDTEKNELRDTKYSESSDDNMTFELRKSKNEAEERCKMLEAQLNELRSQQEELSNLKKINRNQKDEYAQLRKDILELTEEKHEMEEKAEKLAEKLTATTAELEDLRLSYTSRYEADLIKLETELTRVTKEKDAILSEFDIMVIQSTEWMEKSRSLESKLSKLDIKLRETEAQLEEARVLGIPEGGTHVQLRAEFRKQLQWIQSEHRKALDAETQEKEKIESDFRDFKKEIQMQKYRKVTLGVQTYGVYTGDIGALG
ncbi:hypothetical protein HMI54_010400 [Coelomomyces lativittatus]|nr:hypothetical protein HMI56_004791 [Coelomomyces lativittatus]KAJ1516208.1 hypothetical protein HMI54_010400 [Coelomomyces lativittatus]KAJ1517595.1 hypothetical protein HMI55_006591 [Coelomomyces lativittatus]